MKWTCKNENCYLSNNLKILLKFINQTNISFDGFFGITELRLHAKLMIYICDILYFFDSNQPS